MARPREFDETAVLDAATDLFWIRGFDGASTRELAEAMGLTTASLYNAYGDKRTLYHQVLDRYASRALNWCAAALEGGDSGAAALSDFLDALGYETLAAEARGCLVVNAGLELAPHDAQFRAVVANVFRQIEALLRSCIVRGQADGSVTRTQAADDFASLLLGLVLGLRVIARTRPDPRIVQGMVRAAKAALRPS
jgi:TetR/AcrR family transcriptional repressor of nem operon